MASTTVAERVAEPTMSATARNAYERVSRRAAAVER
jgi:hypothetical protein